MLAIIGGSGLNDLKIVGAEGKQRELKTPYADSNVVVNLYALPSGEKVAFIPRHGLGHHLPPHKVNYRANIWALKELGVKTIVAVNAVGSIAENFPPQGIAIPDQLIDYSNGRVGTFFEDDDSSVTHVDFSYPYTESVRQLLITSVKAELLSTAQSRVLLTEGVYACTQGPRLETAAEIARLKRDGCDMVGMTGMPEAVLARELEMDYGAIALSVNWGAGLGQGIITMTEIEAVLGTGIAFIEQCLHRLVEQYPSYLRREVPQED